MDFDNQDIKNFKKVIEDIVDVKLKNEGITKYISAIVTTVNDDNTVDVVIPPDTSKVIRSLYNKTRGDLSVGDSVELCTKNGKLSNAWVSVKHGSHNIDDNLVHVGETIDPRFRVNFLHSHNIFDKDNYDVINAYIATNSSIIAEINNKTVYIQCEPNTTYTITKMVASPQSTNRFRIGTTSVVPEVGGTVDGFYNAGGDGGNVTTCTYTTASNAKYLAITIINRANSSTTLAQMVASLQIQRGNEATPYENYIQPVIDVDGEIIKFSGDDAVSLESAPVGAILPYGGSTAPQDWLICDGSAVSRTTYAELFAVIGTAYGTGDGSTTFNLPNLKGKVPVGLNSSDTSFSTLGKTGGEKTHTLTINEIPSHKHQIKTNNDDFNNSSGGGNYGTTHDGTTNWYNTDWYTENAGGGQAHNNLQPYITVNYVIKYTSTHSTIDLPAQVVNQQSSSTTNTYSCQWFNDHSSSISFPKGFIIAMDTTTTPASVFGGTWEKITNRFLYGVDADNKLKSTDGSSTHTHPLDGANAHALVNFTSGRASLAGRGGTGFTATDGTWTNGFTSGQWNDWTADVVGSTNSASTMPPYYGVYYWRKLD